MADSVNHPDYYNADPSGVECIDIVRHRNFNIGNAIKYLWRQGLKVDTNKTALEKQLQDLEKARWYIDDEIKRLKGHNLPAQKPMALSEQDENPWGLGRLPTRIPRPGDRVKYRLVGDASAW